MPTICERIRAYLKWHGIKQYEIANALCRTNPAMSRILRESCRMHIDDYILICKFCDVPETYFFDAGEWRNIPAVYFRKIGVIYNV